jgi:hypothetical protein
LKTFTTKDTKLHEGNARKYALRDPSWFMLFSHPAALTQRRISRRQDQPPAFCHSGNGERRTETE